MSADYSDLTITCGEKEFKVHRAVICPRSNYFDAACKGEFKVRSSPHLLCRRCMLKWKTGSQDWEDRIER